MPFASYEAALDYLFTATDYERMRRVRYNADTFSLARMRDLLGRLGDPHRGLRGVHVAGTKGKGSTAAMIEALAREAGLRTGLYTSPHLEDLRERIRFGPEWIAPEALQAGIEAARPHVEALRAADDAPTFFEIFTAIAFRAFAESDLDLVVAEVGLGGRLDATNVLVPEVVVITAVSLDHMAQLGTSLAAIAGEKAGIVKPGVPVVVQPQPPEAEVVIREVCRRAGAERIALGRDVMWSWAPRGTESRVTVCTPRAEYADLGLPLMGAHQGVNAATALAAAERVLTAEQLGPASAARALAALDWPGRMEVVGQGPTVVLDGAHNRASLAGLLQAVAAHFPDRAAEVVFACAADKDIAGMVEVLAAGPNVAGVTATRTENPRAAAPTDLAERLAAQGAANVAAVEDAGEALGRARDRAGPGGLVVACGSLYLVGALRRRCREGR